MIRFWFIISHRTAGLFVLLSAFVIMNSANATQVKDERDVGVARIGDLQLDRAKSLWSDGDYDGARVLAESLDTSEGYILASEAITAEILLGYYDKPNKPAKEARKLAEKAVLLDPNNLDARFQQAVAFGLETQSTGILKAWRQKLPRRMYDMIETLQDEAPNDPRGHALLGAWHFGIVNKIGERNANKWYEATLKDGTHYYEMALTLAKDDIVIMSNYAAAMILLDNPDYAQKLLTSVMDMPPRNAAEIGIKKRAAALSALYDDPKALKETAKDFLNHKSL